MSEHSLLRTSIEKQVHISDEQFKHFLAIAKERKYKKGQYLISEGGVVRKTHFIRKGAAIAYFVDNDGTEHVIQFAIEGWWISDIQCFLHGRPALLNVQAIEDCEVYEFPAEELFQAYKDIPAVGIYFLKITQNAFASFQERVLHNLSSSAEDRYKTFCEKYPKLELRFSQKLIASYIGITPEFLSRLKKNLL
jgi:CRP-like cAMP-binding protein